MTADPPRETDRPFSREVADLLSEYRQMITDAGGLTQRIPPDRAAEWQARKAELLDRIEVSTRSHASGRDQVADHARSDPRPDAEADVERGGWSR